MGCRAVAPGGPWGSGSFDVEAPSDLFKFGFSAEDQHEPEISGDFKIVGLNDIHDVVAEGLLALGGGHGWWWVVEALASDALTLGHP